MITKRKGISFSVSCCTGIFKNDFSDITGNNVDGYSLAVDNKVEQLEKFSDLNLDSPFNVYGFIS